MDPRKQKRLGPAPIASFEKSFEDSTAPAANGLPPSMQRVALTITEASEEAMDSTGGGGGGNDDGTDDTEKPPTATTTATTSNDRKATPSRKQLQDIGGKRVQHQQQPLPQPIKTAAVVGGGSVGFMEPIKSATLHTPSTPRIELSRASSSSHHEEDSRDSSPENVFEQVGTGTLQETIGLGFREEGALELRSSTEELFFMDPEAKKEEQEKIQHQLQQARRSSPLIFKFDDHQTYLQQHQRKDSASSEVAALLCISGRTSRISSVGSQGSAVSRLSAISGVSRSPSPHRMLLETSFCGPKPLENVVDGSIVSAVEPPTAEILEQVLLSRKHDPTQAVFAEGIKIESSPQRKKPPPTTISNGEAKRKPTDLNRQSRQQSSSSSSKIVAQRGSRLTPSKSPGQLVVGTTPSGAEYIRINLKPDHMYEDKGIAPNERVIEAPLPGSRPVGHKKPISLSLGRNAVMDEKRLTPSSSPKPSRHSALAKETLGSRSPSPANVSVSRKSSFCSLFKQKDSPDSPKDKVRSRSKSRDRSTPQSQNPTPSKQKSVLAIFKPKRSEGKSKSSSPIDPDFGRHVPPNKLDTPLETLSGTGSRPSSRLRYYDTPPDGKAIHIPLHTPPEEKEARKLLEALEPRPCSAPTPVPAPTIPAAAATAKVSLKQPPTPQTPATSNQPHAEPEKPPSVTTPAPAPATVPESLEKAQKVRRIENLDAIHTLPQDVDDKERTWSLEVNRHSSQDSQDTVLSDSSLPNNCSGRVSVRTNLENVTESPVRENGIAAEVHRVPSESESTVPPMEDVVGREKRRLLFATRLGSGSQEQIFSTQFSLSKTESLSSQLSDQASITENSVHEYLQRKDTVIRRPDDIVITQKTVMTTRKTETLRKLRSVDDVIAPVSKSRSISEDEKQSSAAAAVMMRKKEAVAREESSRRKSSRSASEEDDVATHRHSRYLENFDVRKKFRENVAARKSNTAADVPTEEDARSTDDTPEAMPKAAQESATAPVSAPEVVTEPKSPPSAAPLPPAHLHLASQHHKLPSDRQSVASTDEPVESSESERDSEADPNRLKRHLPRHVVSAIEEHESTGLVSQDSFDDELPYIPTTLPEERAHGVALIPMKERAHMELKTCPLDRPRSTTPLNPSHLEEYCGIVTPDVGDPEHRLPVRGEKLRISLPRKDSTKEKVQKSKSPRRTSTSSGKSWFEFAEEGIRGPLPIDAGVKLPAAPKADDIQSVQTSASASAPTPQTTQTALPNNRKPSGQWIDFENIPEKRKAPKKITTLPKDTLVDGKGVGVVVHYNYVKPEECQCECHEVERESAITHKSIASVDLLNPPGEDLQPLLEPESLDNIDPSDSSRDYSCYTDDESEAPKSNRTQSEEFPLRGTHSPRSKKFPDNRYS